MKIHDKLNNFEEKIPVSVLVQTKNEEAAIKTCLTAWRGHFSEIMVVDSLSTDGTKNIAIDMGVSVIDFNWNGRYPKKKQWQLDHVKTQEDWILFVDADEYPTPRLIEELTRLFREGKPDKVAAYNIKLDYKFAGRTLKHGHTVVKRSLVHRARVRYPELDDLQAPGMGELEGHYQPHANGSVHTLTGRILHDDQDPICTWFERHNKYSEWEAYLATHSTAQSKARKARRLQRRIFDLAPFKPGLFLLYSYIVRQGYRDGRAGFDYALGLSFYYWQIGLKVREQKGWSK